MLEEGRSEGDEESDGKGRTNPRSREEAIMGEGRE